VLYDSEQIAVPAAVSPEEDSGCLCAVGSLTAVRLCVALGRPEQVVRFVPELLTLGSKTVLIGLTYVKMELLCRVDSKKMAVLISWGNSSCCAFITPLNYLVAVKMSF